MPVINLTSQFLVRITMQSIRSVLLLSMLRGRSTFIPLLQKRLLRYRGACSCEVTFTCYSRPTHCLRNGLSRNFINIAQLGLSFIQLPEVGGSMKSFWLYFNQRMSDSAIFLLPVIILTPDSDSASPISYKKCRNFGDTKMLWTTIGKFFTAHAPFRRNSTSGLKSDCRFGLSDIDFLLVINSNYDATSHRFVMDHQR